MVSRGVKICQVAMDRTSRSFPSQDIYFSSFQMQMILAFLRESDPSWSLIKLGFISSLKPMKKSEKESDKKIDLPSI